MQLCVHRGRQKRASICPPCLHRASYGPLRAAAAYAFLRCRHFDLIYSLFLGVRFAAQPRARQQGSVCSALHRARFARKARVQRRQRIAFLLLEVSLFSRASCDAPVMRVTRSGRGRGTRRSRAGACSWCQSMGARAPPRCTWKARGPQDQFVSPVCVRVRNHWLPSPHTIL